MAQIKVKKGLDIPIENKPHGKVQPLIPSGDGGSARVPTQIALDLNPFDDLRFRLHAKVGDTVKRGQPLVEDKACEERMFASPAGGTVTEIRRGLKRRLLSFVIDVDPDEQIHKIDPLDINRASAEQITAKLMEGGLFAKIRSRPFNLLAHPNKRPRSIFVKAVESAPFVPPAELQVEGYEEDFQLGLTALEKLTDGLVHLVYREGTSCKTFSEARDVEKHTVAGPHPASNVSLHIQHLDPITSPEDIVWTLNAHDVVAIGHLLRTGTYLVDRVISIAGPGVLPDQVGYFKARAGYPIQKLIAGRIHKGTLRLISGDPLMGKKVEPEDFLGYNHYAFSVIPENTSREFLHFFRLGVGKYSFSKAYFTGHLDNTKRTYPFTTSQHGEHRAFIDGVQYDQVMPLDVPTMTLVKAVLAEDFDLAESFGLLEVDGEDFALPTFVCPSKMEMTEIIHNGLRQHASEVLA